jgi:hypothetical protein
MYKSAQSPTNLLSCCVPSRPPLQTAKIDATVSPVGLSFAAAAAFTSPVRAYLEKAADGWRGGAGRHRAAAPPEACVPRRGASRLRPRTRQVRATVSSPKSPGTAID